MKGPLHRTALSVLVAVGVASAGIALSGQAPNRGQAGHRGYHREGPTPNRPGQPTFLTEPQSGTPLDLAIAYLRTHNAQLGLTPADLDELTVTSQYRSADSGATHVYLRQQYNGLDVYGADINVNVSQDGRIVSVGNRFISDLGAAIVGQTPGVGAADAARLAAAHAGLTITSPLEPMAGEGGAAQHTLFSSGGIASGPISARLVYQPVGPREVRLAWLVGIDEIDGDHTWSMTVDAQTSDVLEAVDHVDHDTWDTLVAGAAAAGPGAEAPAPMADPTEAYRVFAIPKESPNDGSRTLVVGPARATASPFGWHDTDGAPGAEFTVTRGNNVHAYTDLDANNTADPGSDPDGGSNLVFDFPIDLTQNASTYRPAAVVNLFYWNNIVHDVFYGYGFDEAAGNFQQNNYGKGGIGNDYVRAEAQDGSGTNNANFSTSPDGNRPRMQMYIWGASLVNTVIVNSGALAGSAFEASGSAFGPQFDATGITADVALVNDGTGATSDGCEPFTVPGGSLALLDRGSCNFTVKVKNAQVGGAAGVIVVNNSGGNPITMGGADATITIPSAMISLDNGTALKANLPANVTAKADPTNSITRDSDIDAGVIAHEYGHGISNRLTGGPATTACLRNGEQMGEGWSDFFALVLTAKAGQTGTQGRGIGTYVNFEPSNGFGIRPTPYSIDMSVNPTTYGDIGNLAIPHGVGYAWTTMLWEMYWNLVDRYGFNPDIYGPYTSGGNNLALQLVVDGLKQQVCRPGFVDGRDGILQADMLLTGGANQCAIWRAFAKRGLGQSADQGSNNDTTDGTEAFDIPATCNDNYTLALPGGKTSAKAGSTIPVKFTVDASLGANVFAAGFPASQEVDCDSGAPTASLVPAAAASATDLNAGQGSSFYVYPWKTDPAWAGTCRALVVRLSNGTEHITVFSFD